MSNIDAKIKAIMDEAQRKAEQLRNREEAIHARKLDSIMKKNRASDTRRKILAGALILEMMEKNPDTKTRYMAHLDKYLTKSKDRELFGLPVKDKSAAGEGQADAPAAG